MIRKYLRDELVRGNDGWYTQDQYQKLVGCLSDKEFAAKFSPVVIPPRVITAADRNEAKHALAPIPAVKIDMDKPLDYDGMASSYKDGQLHTPPALTINYIRYVAARQGGSHAFILEPHFSA